MAKKTDKELQEEAVLLMDFLYFLEEQDKERLDLCSYDVRLTLIFEFLSTRSEQAPEGDPV
jgi:hypothetical protein